MRTLTAEEIKTAVHRHLGRAIARRGSQWEALAEEINKAVAADAPSVGDTAVCLHRNVVIEGYATGPVEVVCTDCGARGEGNTLEDAKGKMK